MDKRGRKPDPDKFEEKKVKDLTKGFDEYIEKKTSYSKRNKNNDTENENAKEDFEDLLSKTIKKGED